MPRWALALALLLAGTAAGAQQEQADAAATSAASAVTTIDNLDLPRYMGRWFEIAKLPNRFQAKCAGDTTAQYTLQPGEGVQVVNRCRLENGRVDEAVGQARQMGGASSPKLQVRFAPRWLSFLPQVWGDYWVLDLDPGYRLAAVGDARREYLWILARTPVVPAADYDALLQRLRRQGFEVERLQRTEHTPP